MIALLQIARQLGAPDYWFIFYCSMGLIQIIFDEMRKTNDTDQYRYAKGL